jgi:hypothetical protein
MKKTVIITLILGMIISGVGWWKLHHARIPRRANVVEFESDMTEALLRGIFQELDASKPSVYFVAFGETQTAPGSAFIARFADHRPPVRSLVSSTMPANGMTIETATGRAGVIIQIISFKEFISGTFDVRVSFSNLPPGHVRFVYRVSNVTGEWKIKSRKPE